MYLMGNCAIFWRQCQISKHAKLKVSKDLTHYNNNDIYSVKMYDSWGNTQDGGDLLWFCPLVARSQVCVCVTLEIMSRAQFVPPTPVVVSPGYLCDVCTTFGQLSKTVTSKFKPEKKGLNVSKKKIYKKNTMQRKCTTVGIYRGPG